jgi:hypothetical protein
MADRTIDILLKLKPDDASLSASEKAILKQAAALKKVEEQANRTREKMEKLTQVGSKLALAGAAIVAPLAMSMSKYLADAQKIADTNKTALEPTAQRLVNLSQQWEQSQARLGKITAEIVLPALEKGIVILDKVVAFAEQNPGIVKAALTIGTTLVVLGGILATTAQLVSTVATIQGLAASAGLASVGGAGAGVGAGAAGAAAGGGVAAITGAIVAAAPVLAAAVGAAVGLFLANSFLGTEYGLKDLANIGRLLLVTFGQAIDQVAGIFNLSTSFSDTIGRALGMTNEELQRFDAAVTEQQRAARGENNSNTARQIQATNSAASANIQATNNSTVAQVQATMSLGMAFSQGWASLVAAIRSLFMGGRAAGGYVENGVYRMGERGQEFVLNAGTTRAAEGLIGGRLTQGRALGIMTNNFQIGNGVTIRQTQQAISKNNQGIFNALAGAL